MNHETDAVIVGAGPCGLFQIFELGLLGLKAHIVDALDRPGGQCAELYPDKPIYDIPAIPVCDAQELVDALMKQIEPFDAAFHLSAQVTEVEAIDELRFRVVTSKGEEIIAKSVIVAGGVGSFQPMPLRVAGVEEYVDEQVFYRVQDPSAHHGKDLVVLGGGDSAFDWALELAPHANSLTLVHRSDRFRAAPASVNKMRDLEADGKLNFMVGNLVEFEAQNGAIDTVGIRHPDKSVTELSIDHALVFFGLSPKLGPIAEWGLNLDKNQIRTDTEKFETNIPGIYAIGDIATYPGKKKLILSGFHEAALAAFAIKARLNPDEKVHLQYTTTSPIMHERLGVPD
ncbi:MAG: NAD(P)/FAD-dependent oxidoreductase [Gammaproteobacteria bacterium]|nr:NAD(P)/FAD-dependent oxidoreductase [Gammaproteobacteria bacterium]MYB35796.1 NAD(P)/FAD-dependent oxidoreductase [Gammaproteobacteria bacterium]